MAKGQRDRLLPDVPELTLTLPPNASPGTLVTRDGKPMAAAALGVGVPVDPGGAHGDDAAPGRAGIGATDPYKQGEKKQVMLDGKVAPPVKPAPPLEADAAHGGGWLAEAGCTSRSSGHEWPAEGSICGGWFRRRRAGLGRDHGRPDAR